MPCHFVMCKIVALHNFIKLVALKKCFFSLLFPSQSVYWYPFKQAYWVDYTMLPLISLELGMSCECQNLQAIFLIMYHRHIDGMFLIISSRVIFVPIFLKTSSLRTGPFHYFLNNCIFLFLSTKLFSVSIFL